MKKALKYVFASLAATAAILYMVVSLVASGAARRESVCTGVRITIRDSASNSLVDAGEIRRHLDKEYGKYRGRPADSVNLAKIERIIDGESAVRKSEAYMTRDGILNIYVTQRTPMIRFQKKNGGFYADKEGFLFPLQPNYTSLVPIIDGHIPLKADSGYKGAPSDKKGKEWLDDIIALVKYMDGSIWGENIVQITVNEKGDLVMVPREGKEKFIFGKPESFEKKFEKIGYYYSHVKPSKEDGYYSSVNVKYDNQIICRK